MSLSQLEQQNKFKKHLGEYWASKGITQIKIPQIGGQQLNLFKLYKTVCKKGGGQSVSHNKLWKQIVDEFGLPSTCTSASFTLKNHYQKYLLGYEQRFFFGKQDTSDLPELVAGRQRKPIIKGGQNYGNLNILNQRFQIRTQNDILHSSLSNEIKKYYEKSDPNQTISYIKRTKLYPVMPQVKHLIMAFLSNIDSQVIYGINTLLLFSVNTQAPFLFNQYPFVIEAITSYVSKNYPPKNIFQMECLRTLSTALRNLLMNNKNLQAILESDLLQVLFKMFEEKLDRQIFRNVTDIFSSLTRVGLDFNQLFDVIQQYLEKETYEDIQTGIDLLRSLIQQNQELFEQIIFKKMDYFARLLVYSSVQIRESILQIFANLTDKYQNIRNFCLSNFKFMDRLFAILSFGANNNEKQAQFACFILNNIFQLNTPASFQLFKKYQRVLTLVSFNDQNLSPITSSILFVLSGRASENSMLNQNDKQNIVIQNMRKTIRKDIEGQSNSSIEEEQQQSQGQIDEE